MSVVQRAVVGRKTPGDGKLEVSSELAIALGGNGAAVRVRDARGEQPGVVTAFECTCAKAAVTGKHQHHFVQCDAFRELPVGTQLRLKAAAAHLEVELG